VKKTFIIAEAGVNHNGDRSMAEGLVRAAAIAGADAVKFQTFRAEDLASKSAEMAEYQKKNIGKESSQQEMLKALELPREWHSSLKELAEGLGLEFLSTPFDPSSLKFLVEDIGVPRIKLGSGELTNGPLLYQAAAYRVPLILSTGMGKLSEIRQALLVIKAGFDRIPKERISFGDTQSDFSPLKNFLTILHCVTDYPAADDSINLLAMELIREEFGLSVGYSDHTLGIEASVAAVALGANVIEKHITLDKSLPGPDHFASLDPEQFKSLVLAVRKVDQLLGKKKKEPSAAELKIAKVARKSLVAARPIRQGEPFDEGNLCVKRPGSGVSPMMYWAYLGKPAKRNYQEGELID
jgi:N-acetylneuraminate synthase